jgi:hypothetical protein
VGFHHRRASTPSGSHPSVTHHACSQRMMRAVHPLSLAREGTREKIASELSGAASAQVPSLALREKVAGALVALKA